MNHSWLQRLVLASFPARFRARYGDELDALVPEYPGGWRVTTDLARAAAREWVRPCFPGPPEERRRLRLQATTATVFFLWSVSTLAVAIFGRAVDDHPVPGLRSWGWTAYGVGTVVFELTAAGVLTAGFGYWLRVVLPAWRDRDRSTLLAAALPAMVVTVWLGLTGLVAVLGHLLEAGSHRHLNAQAPTTAAGLVVLAGYVLFTVACVLVCSGSAVRALSRSELSDRLLAASTLVATAVTGTLVVVTSAAAVCLTRVLMVGGISGRDTAMSVGPVAFLVLAAAAAATSTARGLRPL